MYNRAAFGLAVLRINRFTDNFHSNDLDLNFIELELESALSFQVGTGVTALTYLVDLCRARVAVLRGRFEEAAHMLFELRERARFAHNSAESVAVDIDLAWCLTNSGYSARAEEIVSAISLTDIQKLDIDDKVIAVSVLADIAQNSKNLPLALGDQFSLATIRESYIANVAELRDALEKVEQVVVGRSSNSQV
jgi:hypothetical protein